MNIADGGSGARPPAWPAQGNGDPALSSLESGLRLLLEAKKLAEEVGRTVWDFAVEIQVLREAGTTYSRLRWLVCKGLVEHGRETYPVSTEERGFQPTSGLSFSQDTGFVLTAAGASFAKEILGTSVCGQASATALACNGSCRVPATVPKWDHPRQELRLGATVIKQFKVRAANQERILAAFEEEGWPCRIDDPLPPQVDQDPKRRLHDTINSLNHNRIHPLVRFLGDGTGQGVRWELVEIPETAIPPSSLLSDKHRSNSRGGVPEYPRYFR